MQISATIVILSLGISLILIGVLISVLDLTMDDLKGLVDPVTSLLALLATAILLGFMYVQIDSQIKQHKFQRRIESSKILNEYYRRFYDEHRDIQIQIMSNKKNKYDESKLDGFLEDFEYLAIMYSNELVKFEHIFEIFAILLLAIRDDEQIKERMNYMKNKYSNKKIKLYSNLENLVEKIYEHQNS